MGTLFGNKNAAGPHKKSALAAGLKHGALAATLGAAGGAIGGAVENGMNANSFAKAASLSKPEGVKLVSTFIKKGAKAGIMQNKALLAGGTVLNAAAAAGAQHYANKHPVKMAVINTATAVRKAAVKVKKAVA